MLYMVIHQLEFVHPGQRRRLLQKLSRGLAGKRLHILNKMGLVKVIQLIGNITQFHPGIGPNHLQSKLESDQTDIEGRTQPRHEFKPSIKMSFRQSDLLK